MDPNKSVLFDSDCDDSFEEHVFRNSTIIENPFKNNAFFSNNDSLTFMHINIRSLRANFDQLLLYLQSANHKFTGIICSEIWINEEETCLYEIEGYKAHFYCRPDKRAGGLAVYLSHDVIAHYSSIFSLHADFLKITCVIDDFKYEILAIYRYHDGDLKLFTNELNNIIETINYKDIIVLGDININLADLNTAEQNAYLDNLLANGFVSFMNLPTRVTSQSKTCIDHIFVRSNDLSQYESALLHLDITDHYPIILKLNTCSTKNNSATASSNHSVEKINFDMLKEFLSNTDWTVVLSELDVNTAMGLFIEILQLNIKKATYTKHQTAKKRKIKPWMTTAILNSVRTKNKMYKRMKKYCDNTLFRDEYVNYRNHLKNVIAEAKEGYYQTKMKNASNDSRKQWSVINEITGSKTQTGRSPTELLIDGKTITIENNPKQFTNEFNSFFASVGENLAKKISSNTRNEENYMNFYNNSSFFMTPVTEDELHKLINDLKPGKSPGLDGITASVVKHVRTIIAPILAYLYNLSFTSGVFPKILKHAVVIPIFKKGCPKNPSNYRPIALLSVFSKLLEKAMKKRLVSFLEKNKLFHWNQYGFRNNNSTEDAVLNMLTQIYSGLDSNSSVIGIFLDLMKAFDTVNHKRLVSKLEHYGVRGIAKNWFMDYLENRTQITRVAGNVSDNVSVNSGVPQGSTLGPILFLVYLNDIFYLNIDSNITSFADDTAVLNINKNKVEANQSIERDLKVLSDWFRENLLTLNTTKCDFMRFSLNNVKETNNTNIKMHTCTQSQLLCDCPQIQEVQDVKYLGVVLDNKLNWKNQVKAIIRRLRAFLCKIYYLRKFVSLDTLKMFYFAMCQSVIQYSIICWGGTYKNAINPIIKLQNKIVRAMTFKSNRESSFPIYQQLGILPARHLYVYRTLINFRKNNAHNTTRYHTTYHTRSEEDRYVVQPKVTKEKLHKSCFYLGSKFYNNLPIELKEISSKNRFKKLLYKWLLELNPHCIENLFIVVK